MEREEVPSALTHCVVHGTHVVATVQKLCACMHSREKGGGGHAKETRPDYGSAGAHEMMIMSMIMSRDDDRHEMIIGTR